MTLNQAFKKIFLGYAFIFLDLNILIDIIPDILGYYWIAQGWTTLCGSGLTGLSKQRQGFVRNLIRALMIIHILTGTWRLFDGDSSTTGSFWDVTVPETPPVFHFELWAIASLLLFAAGIWLMKQILIASRNIAEFEGKAAVTRSLDRSIGVLEKVYLPVGVIIVLMEQCITLPEVWWGNVIHGIQELGTLMYFCFQLMLVLQIANLRKNLDCCSETADMPGEATGIQ